MVCSPVVMPDKREAHLSHAAVIDETNSEHFDKRRHRQVKSGQKYIYTHRNFARYMETIIAMLKCLCFPQLPTHAEVNL